MKNNAELQQDVQDAIKWEPLLNAAEIGVTVKNGVVTLTGVVDSYMKKLEAEEATKNVAGVKAVVEKIEIKFNNNGDVKDDNEIANEILNALNWNWRIPKDQIKVKVENGFVTLEGELQWKHQKDATKNAVKNLPGIKGIYNNLTIKSGVHNAIEKKDIENALERNWSIDAKEISVHVSGTKVTLNGHVVSLYEKEEAERIAWNTPGIWSVDNDIEVEYDYAYN